MFRGLMGERVYTRGASFGTGKVEDDGVIRGERDPAARGIGVKCHHTRQRARARDEAYFT